jgi:hypothetical protein
MLSINAILWIPFIFASTIALTDIVPPSIVGLLILFPYYAGSMILPLVSPIVSIPTAVGVSVKLISNYKKKARLIKTIKESIFEPGKAITVPAHSTIIKTLFCPKEELPESFEVELTHGENKNTFATTIDLI